MQAACRLPLVPWIRVGVCDSQANYLYFEWIAYRRMFFMRKHLWSFRARVIHVSSTSGLLGGGAHELMSFMCHLPLACLGECESMLFMHLLPGEHMKTCFWWGAACEDVNFLCTSWQCVRIDKTNLLVGSKVDFIQICFWEVLQTPAPTPIVGPEHPEMHTHPN